MHSKEFVEKMKEQLLEEKEKLSEELGETSAHPEMDAQGEDNAEREEVDEVNQDIITQLNDDIKAIDDALANIEKGTYGICEVGGEEISEERLAVIPWAKTCIEHAQQA